MQQDHYPDESFNNEPTEANPVPVREPIRPIMLSYTQYVQNRSSIQQNTAYPEQQNTRRAVAEQERAYTTAFIVGKVIDYIGWVLLVLEVALALRFMFKLIGADPVNPFTLFFMA
jgi:hypothetical protein